jgi:hypothetical protein
MKPELNARRSYAMLNRQGGLLADRREPHRCEPVIVLKLSEVAEFLMYYEPFMMDAAEWMEQSCEEQGLPLPFSHAETLIGMRAALMKLIGDPNV